ncbi:MAG: hypothetical protein JSR21_09720 [Proteobacteria bacterium]|nr:hypothetical protein [Pseudomonadota bacterium]
MTTYSDAPKPSRPGDTEGGRSARVWTRERDETLIALHRTGLGYGEIAAHMGISVNAAAARIAVMIRRGILTARRGKFAHGFPIDPIGRRKDG